MHPAFFNCSQPGGQLESAFLKFGMRRFSRLLVLKKSRFHKLKAPCFIGAHRIRFHRLMRDMFRSGYVDASLTPIYIIPGIIYVLFGASDVHIVSRSWESCW